MTERVLIFIIVAATIVATLLIGGIVSIIKYICEAKSCKYSAYSMAMMQEMGIEPDPEGEFSNGN